MCKLTIAGPKTKRSDVVELLHKKGVLHIEDYVRPADEVELDIGSPSGNAKELSDILLKTRSIKSHLNIGDKCSNHDLKRAMIKNPAKVNNNSPVKINITVTGFNSLGETSL